MADDAVGPGGLLIHLNNDGTQGVTMRSSGVWAWRSSVLVV